MNFLNICLLVISIVSSICVLIISPFALIEYFLGPEDAMKLLKRLKIPWSYKTALIVCFTCVGILLVSYFLRKILFQ